ncbi:MAG: peptide-methionine (S)-S-oxide reductase MsrA [Bacteriovoracaceae bacterium]|nr:peptide-methionine (S)-S-oxide reductase MsrA [Bacteriovoracaceae bacterium]
MRLFLILSLLVFNVEAKVKTEVATLAGGCFWGMEEIIREIPGVISTQVGYTGGKSKNATYIEVKTGQTGHAESVKIEFDPTKLSYETLLEWFFRMHNPTTKNQQGNDIGSQYRSAIFYNSETQRAVAQKIIERVDKSGVWKKPIVTEVVPATDWWDAEDYHQDYLKKNPGGYTCHFVRDVKF